MPAILRKPIPCLKRSKQINNVHIKKRSVPYMDMPHKNDFSDKVGNQITQT